MANKQTHLIIFNKLSGAKCAVTPCATELDSENAIARLNKEHYKYKVVDMVTDKEDWYGDYDTGEVREIAAQPIQVSEGLVNAVARDKILKRYPIERQLSIQTKLLGAVLDILGKDILDDELVNEFRDMEEYITQIKANNNRMKEHYAESAEYEYKDHASVEKDLNDKMEGGIHEILGRKSNLKEFTE